VTYFTRPSHGLGLPTAHPAPVRTRQDAVPGVEGGENRRQVFGAQMAGEHGHELQRGRPLLPELGEQ